MPITIDGAGTITGISAGGLPDDCIVTADIADNNVTTAKIDNSAVSQAKRSEDLTLETAKSATGTSVDFTGIPSWVKRVTVMLSGVSTSGTSNLQVQLGSGSVVTTGYLGNCANQNGSTTSAFSTGFIVSVGVSSTSTSSGRCVIDLLSSNVYVETSALADYSVAGALRTGSGSISLGGTLDRVRITTVNGTDTFDAGSINIMYE